MPGGRGLPALALAVCLTLCAAVEGGLVVKDVSINVLERDGGSAKSQKIKPPTKLKQALELDHTQTLQVGAAN